LAELIKTGTLVEVMVTLPDQVTLAGTVRVDCLGHVQRCELKAVDKWGIAVAFEKLEFIEPK
jgi:hypothetical protein